MRLAIAKAKEGIAAGQSPFGAVIVCDGRVVATAHNSVWRDNDPTAHGQSCGVYHRIPMEPVAPPIEYAALRARAARGAKRTHDPDGSVNGRPPAGAWSERCQAKRWLASVPGLPYAAGATGVWLLGSASGQPATLWAEMPPPSLCVGATASTGMMPLLRECGCARRRDAWRGNRPRWGGGGRR